LCECIDNVVKDRISGGGGGGGSGGPGSSSFEHITKKYDIKSIPAIVLNVDFFTSTDCCQFVAWPFVPPSFYKNIVLFLLNNRLSS